jgi:UrcA family protein
MSHLSHAVYGAALAMSLGLSAGSGASEQHSSSMTVHYSDLSLQRPADVKVLYQRIQSAADRVCGQRELTGSHLPLAAWVVCHDKAVSQAVDAVASPALNAYYQSLPGHLPPQAPAVAQR